MDVEGLIEDCRQELDDGGFTVAALVGDELGCDWAYTIGLHRNFGHCELVVVGLEASLGGALLEVIGRQIADGVTIEPEHPLTVDGGLELLVRPVDPLFGSHGDWFNLGREVMSCWGERWPASLQLVWTDPGADFPEPGDPRWSMRQPLLYSTSAAPRRR